MSYGGALLIVLLSAGAAGLASLLVARFVGLEVRRRHYDVGSAVFLQLGVIYAVLVAFVFSEVWGEYNTAKQAINAECGALHGSAMLARGLPGEAGAPFERAVAAYVSTVIAQEWPLMARRQVSAAAIEAMQAMLSAAARIETAQPGNPGLRDQILSQLASAHAQRETRLFQMAQGIPALLWAMLIFYTAVLAGFVVFAGAERVALHVLLAALFAGCTVLMLVVIRMLDYPFESALALGPVDFQTTLDRVARLAASYGGGT